MNDAQNRHRIYEGLVTYLYQHELDAGDTFLDIGANIGHHTWQMAEAVGPKGQGFAVEPVPQLVERVTQLLANKSIECVTIEQNAVSDQPGSAEFFFRPSHIGWSSLFAEHVHPEDSDADLERFEVEIRTIDDLFGQRMESLAFVKLDIEHSEFRALRSGRQLLTTHRPMLVFENSPLKSAEVSGYELSEFFDFFAEVDYQLFDIYLNPFSLDILEGTAPEALSTYYVGLPSEHPGCADPKTHYGISNEYERLTAQ